MNKQKSIFRFFKLIIILALSNSIIAQNYTPLVCSGPLPDDFKISSSEKYKKQLESISGNSSRSDRKSEKEFALATHFQIDKLLRSGMILFGDDISNYVTKVGQKIIDSNKDLNGANVRFYTSKSSAVNAFSTQQGIIILTMGLIANLENEAQLAMVLSHELAHFNEKHHIKKYKHQKKILKENRNDFTYNLPENFFKNSKEAELEADKVGLKYYEKSGYALSEVGNAFDVMLYGYLPFDEIAFDFKQYQDSLFILDSSILNVEKKEISAREDVDDKHSTHPNIKKRRSNLIDETEDEEGGEYYIVSEKEFNKIQEISRYELCKIYLMESRFISALFNCHLLDKTYHRNEYTTQTSTIALLAISNYFNKDKEETPNEDNVDDSYTRPIEGEMSVLKSFLMKIDNKALSVLAARQAWKAHRLFPKNELLDKLANQSLENMLYFYDFDYKHFINSRKKLTKKPTTKKKKRKSKYTKIKEEKDKKSLKAITQYGFISEITNKDFKDAFTDAKDVAENKKEKDAKDEDKDEGSKNNNKKDKKVALGIKKIIMLNPSISMKGGYLDSEKERLKVLKAIDKSEKSLDLDIIFLDPLNSSRPTTESFNKYVAIMDLLREISSNIGLDNDKTLSSIYTDKILEEFGTHYLASLSFKSGDVGPWGEYNSYFRMIVMNLKTEETDYYRYIYTKRKYNGNFRNAQLFNSLFKINRDK